MLYSLTVIIAMNMSRATLKMFSNTYYMINQ